MLEILINLFIKTIIICTVYKVLCATKVKDSSYTFVSQGGTVCPPSLNSKVLHFLHELITQSISGFKSKQYF